MHLPDFGGELCITVEKTVEMSHNSRISTEPSRKNGHSGEKTSTGKAVPVDKILWPIGERHKKTPQHLKILWTNFGAEGKEKTRDLSISGYGVDNGTRTHDLQSHNLTP